MKNEEIRKLNFSGWPLPDDYLIEVGRVSVMWSALEAFLNLCIGKLTGFNELEDPKPFILLNHASFPQRLDMLGALCEQLVPEYPQLAHYKEVISVLRSAQTLRNKFAHNSMRFNQSTGKAEMASGSARGRLKVSVEQIDLADIRRATIAIDEASAALYKLVLGRDIGPVWQRRQAEHL
jgi:hypothetical protein